MKYIVTGGVGFIGSNLVNTLVNEGPGRLSLLPQNIFNYKLGE